MKVLIICSAGVSATYVEKSMLEFMKKNGIEGTVDTATASSSIKMINNYDVVLVAPQEKSFLQQLRTNAHDTLIDLMTPTDFSLARGENLVNHCKRLLSLGKATA